MNKLKEYIKKKKVDNTFKHLGKGYVLSGEQSSSQAAHSGSANRTSPSQSSAEARARAAAAVEKRWNEGANKMSASQRAVYMQAKREIEREQQTLTTQSDERALNFENRPTPNDSQNEDDSVLYTCDLLSDMALPKSDIREAVEVFLRGQLIDEALCSSILMIHSLNRPSQISIAVETIRKYLTNICNNPEEQKYRKIRKSNKVFQEKILPVKGAEEFLKAIGFVEEEISGENGLETHLIMPNDVMQPLELQDALQELCNGSPVTIRLFRDPKVFSIDPNKAVPMPEPSADFYNLKVSELKQKHEEQKQEVERLTTLRTRKMREEDAGISSTLYKRAIIRVRFPNHFVLQGIFNACEATQAVREFIYEHLDYQEGEFMLHTTTSGLNDEKTLTENGLAPSSVINFIWTDSTLAHFRNLQCPPTYLKCELERKADIFA